jgi:hypothetical protein
MKTTGAVLLNSMGCFIQTEKTSDPAGETHTFEPRPRPATCVVAVHVNPVGRWARSFAFLLSVSVVAVEKFSATYFSNNVLVLVTTSP